MSGCVELQSECADCTSQGPAVDDSRAGPGITFGGFHKDMGSPSTATRTIHIYLPANYVYNTITYTGTRDNPTTRGWFEELNDEQRRGIWNYLKGGARSSDAARALIELAWSSFAALAMMPLQDLLNLGKEARMNVPGRAEGNWRWRCTEEMLADSAFEWLSELTKRTSRSGTAVAYGVKKLEVASTN